MTFRVGVITPVIIVALATAIHPLPFWGLEKSFFLALPDRKRVFAFPCPYFAFVTAVGECGESNGQENEDVGEKTHGRFDRVGT